MENLKLSLKERLSLVLQYRILQKLSSNETDYSDYENKIIALLRGYELHYNDLLDEFSDEPLSIEECRFVLDILEMYRGIIFSYCRLSRENKCSTLSDDNIRFPGFDGNEECKYLYYARYFIDDLGRYAEIKQYSPGDMDNHMPTINSYEAMLEKWRTIKQPYRYSMDESLIIDLLKIGGWML